MGGTSYMLQSYSSWFNKLWLVKKERTSCHFHFQECVFLRAGGVILVAGASVMAAISPFVLLFALQSWEYLTSVPTDRVTLGRVCHIVRIL